MRVGDLQVVEEEGNKQGRKFLLGTSETMEYRWYLAKRLGVILTNARVKILKTIKPRFPS